MEVERLGDVRGRGFAGSADVEGVQLKRRSLPLPSRRPPRRRPARRTRALQAPVAKAPQALLPRLQQCRLPRHQQYLLQPSRDPYQSPKVNFPLRAFGGNLPVFKLVI